MLFRRKVIRSAGFQWGNKLLSQPRQTQAVLPEVICPLASQKGVRDYADILEQFRPNSNPYLLVLSTKRLHDRVVVAICGSSPFHNYQSTVPESSREKHVEGLCIYSPSETLILYYEIDQLGLAIENVMSLSLSSLGSTLPHRMLILGFIPLGSACGSDHSEIYLNPFYNPRTWSV